MALRELASDSFNRADNIDLGASWDVGFGLASLQIVGNAVRAGAGASVRQEHHNAVALPANQFSEITMKTVNAGSNYIGVVVRAADGAETYYLGIGNIGLNQVWIYKVVATVYTELATVVGWTFAAGDVLRLDARGTQISLYKNNERVLTATDATIASGKAGFRIYNNTGLANVEIESWRAGDFVPDGYQIEARRTRRR